LVKKLTFRKCCLLLPGLRNFKHNHYTMHFKKRPVIFLAFAFLIFLAQGAFAQRRDRERERPREREEPREREDPRKTVKDEPKDFKSRLWYGGGVNIGFGGFNGFSSFNFGLSPMVGYKIIGPLSVGPRIAYDFTSLKQRGFKSLNLHSFDAGVFVRCRAFMGLFFQAELSNQWYQDLDDFTGEKYNDRRVNQRLGAGWNFGQPGGTGSEISVLYNFKVANDLNTFLNPIEYRFGFTWKF